MIAMVTGINKAYFGGKREVTCYSCHRGGDRPLVTPSLAEQYGPPAPPREPDEILQPAPRPVPPEQVLSKYIEAVGGAQKVAALTSFSAKGTFQGYGETDKQPVEIFAKAPAQRTMIVRGPSGDTTTTFDGRAGWIAAPATDKPVPITELTGGELDGAKLEAMLSFPGQIKQALSQWRTGRPSEIDDQEVQLVQGTNDGRYPVNLYFDAKTGLLLRMVRFTDATVGLNPTQVDYADYREVAGVKIPFKWTLTWTDGRSVIELSDVQPNAAIDPAKFAKPAAPQRAAGR
jgi:outer membrane lipoprotein-sorting protein